MYTASPKLLELISASPAELRFIEYLQKEKGAVQGNGGDNQTYRVAAMAHEMGVSKEAAFDLVAQYYNPKCSPPWPYKELRDKVENGYKYARNEAGSRDPGKEFGGKDGKKNQTAVLNGILSEDAFDVFGYDLMAERVVFTKTAQWRTSQKKDFTDNDLIQLTVTLALEKNFSINTDKVWNGVIYRAMQNSFHPIKKYLDGLKWDGVKRLDTWLSAYLGAEDTAYTRACASKFLTAAVARIYEPGCKFDSVLVLEGGQEVGKSRTAELLAGEWAADFPVDPHSKDVIQALQGKWIVELAEMEVTRRSETDALKAFLSRRIDRVRVAYGRIPKDYPRQFIFLATKNLDAEATYLRDDTGNRRWWPVRCRDSDFDLENLKRDRDQIFAEAATRYKEGAELWMGGELRRIAAEEVEKRRSKPAWFERISEWLREREAAENLPDKLTTQYIYTGALDGSNRTFSTADRKQICECMRLCGYEYKQKKFDNYPVRVFVKKEMNIRELL